MILDGKTWQRLLWTVAALAVCVWQGRFFVESLRPPRTLILDFFQEWASARNFYEGLPIYTHQEVTARRYLGYQKQLNELPMIRFNAHPPTSVLLALPLAPLDYPDAFLAWELLSLGALGLSIWIVAHQLPSSLSRWSILPLMALLLLCNGFRQHMLQGQLGLVLLLLVTAAWAAERSGQPAWAGILIGTATAIKLFPGLLFVYLLARRQWRAVRVGALALVVVTALTALVLGPSCYRDYLANALPSLDKYRVGWPNLSLAGFWHKLFNAPRGSKVIPLWQQPILAWGGLLVSDAVVIGLTAWAAAHSRSRAESDLAFASTVTAMLLVSPITWDHYFTILFLSLFLLWYRLPASGLPRVLFWVLLVVLWITPLAYWKLSMPKVEMSNWFYWTATPSRS